MTDMTTRTFKTTLFIVIASLLIQSCKTQYEILLTGNDVDAKYEAAFDYFNHGKYSKASQLFENLTVLTSNTDRDDTVHFYWGLSNYRFRDYYTAETNFSKFLMTFPYSPFYEEAAFLRIDCLYRSTFRWELDQAPTYSAIEIISQYIQENPKSTHVPICRKMLAELNERLDKKAFENAVAKRGTSVVEIVATCNSGWKLSPVEANKWMEENMFTKYPLGDLKNV